MKTIDKKKYTTPQMEIVLIQNQKALLTGSNTNVDVDDREYGGEIGN